MRPARIARTVPVVVALVAACGGARSSAPATPGGASASDATTSAAAPATDGSTPGASSADAAPGAAHVVVVVGVARDAKGGAVIVGDDGTTTRVDGYDSWPPALVDRRVVAEGRLEIRQGPACASDPVLPCQGIVGSYRALAGAKVRLQ